MEFDGLLFEENKWPGIFVNGNERSKSMRSIPLNQLNKEDYIFARKIHFDFPFFTGHQHFAIFRSNLQSKLLKWRLLKTFCLPTNLSIWNQSLILIVCVFFVCMFSFTSDAFQKRWHFFVVKFNWPNSYFNLCSAFVRFSPLSVRPSIHWTLGWV